MTASLEGNVKTEDARRLLDEVAAAVTRERKPGATYRVQLHKGFDFDAAAAIARYLADLGITDFYTSPYLKSGPGSMHGYDVLDHQQINPELGGEEGHARLMKAIREAGLGHLLDIVPNHMGIGSGNLLWRDVLENGPSAQAARFFDVEWHPVKEELADKVLVPVLGDRYGAVLERGEIKLVLTEGGAFEIHYFGNVFPVNPRSYVQILGYRIEDLEKLLDGDVALDDLKSIITALQNMPTRREIDPAKMEERRREKEVAKRRVAHHCEKNTRIRAHLEENVRIFNGTPGKPRTFDLLDKLLAAQAYRLAHWRVSSEEINYRRFFDINSLAAIRVEDPVVFEEAHRLPMRLLAEGKVTGLRVDHPDGLAYPTHYFRLLQDARAVQLARALAESRGLDFDEPVLREELSKRVAPDGPFWRPLYVVAEKILGRTERLPARWAVAGTTGYDYLNSVNGIFVDRSAEEALEKIYARFIGRAIDFDDLLYEKKKLILYTALASEMNLLARQLNRISEGNRWTRDFTLYALRAGLIELVACFPVYRTYIGENESAVDERDRGYILQAVASAKRRNPAENGSIYDFVADILLQKFAAYVEESERPAQKAFAVKLQQVLGPVMAKGCEDTAFYVYNRLVSLNEVGGEPQHFGGTVEAFHEANQVRARDWPGSLLATSTHDTKRGEDTRARIDAISELTGDWRKMLTTLARTTEPLRREVDGRKAPDRNEQVLLLQTLAGVWPCAAGLPAREELMQLRDRVHEYLFKAAKEAKVNTSWIQEDARWEEALRAYVEGLFELPARHPFWKAFLPFARRVGEVGLHNSLAQCVLKLASPGVPDIYQGCELWDLTLVDPDNRRPIDFDLRRRTLEEIRSSKLAQAELARSLYESWEDGRIKLHVTQAALGLRRKFPKLFSEGSYVPLQVSGPRAANICAFARVHEGRFAIAVVPRLVAGLLEGPKLPARAFEGTTIEAPTGAPLRDVLTGEQRSLAVDELFATLPVALLASD